jgi:hypothetical protein
LQLKITPRLKRLEGLAYNLGGVFEAGNKSTTMNIIEFLAKDPLVFCIIDLEVAVRWNAL